MLIAAERCTRATCGAGKLLYEVSCVGVQELLQNLLRKGQEGQCLCVLSQAESAEYSCWQAKDESQGAAMPDRLACLALL